MWNRQNVVAGKAGVTVVQIQLGGQVLETLQGHILQRVRSNQAADTIIGVFSSSAVALGIFIATWSGGSFTKYNKYLIGDILSVTPAEIGMLALVLLAVVIFWCIYSNHLALKMLHNI